jgi:hypothetical protein
MQALAQSNGGSNCQEGQPASLQNLLPTQCCDIRFIFDDQTVEKCMSSHQGLSNVNVGVKGRFDGLEVRKSTASLSLSHA